MANYLIPTVIVCLLFMNNIHMVEQVGILSVGKHLVSIGKTLFNVAKFALGVYDIFNGGDDGNAGKVEQLLEEIPKLLEASTTANIKNTLLVSKLERIDDAVIAVHSSLVDINHMLANNGTERKHYEDLFLTHYQNSNLIVHIRFLPSLLTYEIPGAPGPSGTLMDLWIDSTRCNMTSLYELKQFYFRLVSSGIAIQAINNAMTTNNGISIDDTLEVWEPRIKAMDETFNVHEDKCKAKFEQLIREDIRNNKDPVQLKNILDERYPYKIHDVYFLPTPGTFQLIYHESTNDIIKWERVSDITRLVASIDQDDLDSFRNINSTDGQGFKSLIINEEDIDAARHVGVGIKKQLMKDTGYVVEGLISYFDYGSRRQLFNEDSPVMSTEVKDVTLRYCHKTGFECAFTGKAVVHGKIVVYYYLRAKTPTNQTNTVIGAAQTTYMPSPYNIILVGFITATLFTCSLLD